MHITDLLHINDCGKNKLIDLRAGDLAKTFYITNPDCESISYYVLNLIRSRIGKPGNTAMRKSALDPARENILGTSNSVSWFAADETESGDPKKLHRFIEKTASHTHAGH